MKVRTLALVVIATLCGTLASMPARAAGCDPYDQSTWPTLNKIQDLGLGGDLAGVTGLWAAPAAAAPTRMVVFMHGYGNDSAAWTCHLADAASRGAIAFATDYRGNTSTRGWHVQEGAEESVALAQYFTQRYTTIQKVGILGISMGGNSSGLAVAQDATRIMIDSKGHSKEVPMFDYWVDVEGVANMAEEYVLARAVGLSGNVFAQNAQADMEAECGGAIETGTQGCFQSHSLVAKIRDIQDEAVSGIVIVHGIDDGLVPPDQSRQLYAEMRALRMPVDFVTVARRNDGDPGREGGTTLTGNVGGPLFAAAGQGAYPAPLAGHGWEGSNTQLVIATGFKHFWNMMDGKNTPAGHEWLADGSLGEQQLA